MNSSIDPGRVEEFPEPDQSDDLGDARKLQMSEQCDLALQLTGPCLSLCSLDVIG
jgi:hypothetical protein